MSLLEFKHTVSRGQYTEGWNIVTLYVDGEKVAQCNGGGYDMMGTVLASWMSRKFKDELLKLKAPFYGLKFYDPDFKPGQVVIDGETIEEREKSGKSLGLDRYQAIHGAAAPLPDEKHRIPSIDGATGMSSVERILEAIGYRLRWIKPARETRSGPDQYILEKVE